MSHATRPEAVHEIVDTLTQSLTRIDTSFTPDELAVASFRFLRFMCSGVLGQTSDRSLMRERLIEHATTLLFALQPDRAEPIDGGLVPKRWKETV